MTRISTVDCSKLTPEQRELYDSISGGPRAAKRRTLLDDKGNLTGPFNAFLHRPSLGKHWSAIGEELRFRTKLDRRLFELTILTIAVYWRAGHEWASHAAIAAEAGVSQVVIDALRRGERPKFDKRDEETLYDFVNALVSNGRASDRAYKAILSVVGEPQLVELVNAIGYYVALAVMLNAFEVHPPAGLDDPWPKT